jgi:hypothetical protein
VNPVKGSHAGFLHCCVCEAIKKADVVKLIGFHRVGLLFNPPADWNRHALYLVVRIPQMEVSLPDTIHIIA